MKSGQSPWTRVAGHPTMGFLYERHMVENGWMEVSVYIVLTRDATFFFIYSTYLQSDLQLKDK